MQRFFKRDDKRYILLLSLLVLFTAALIILIGDNLRTNKPDLNLYEIPDRKYFPKSLNIPESNPITVEGIQLGKYLFYDGRLSGSDHPDSLMSCASCHVQKHGFGTNPDHPEFKGYPRGMRTAEFPDGKPSPHVTLPLINLIYNSNGYGWNGAFNSSNSSGSPLNDSTSLESIVLMKIMADWAMAGEYSRTEKMIASIPEYEIMFKQAFGYEKVSVERISMAIAQFIRTINTSDFKYYLFYKKEAELTPGELRGMQLFYSEKTGCFHCHSGSLLMTSNQFANNALDESFKDPYDRMGYTGKNMDRGVYRIPSLINCEFNAPYMHDGRFRTLDQVIDFYSEGLKKSRYADPLIKGLSEGGIHLSAEEKSDLKAFLLTLSDPSILYDPEFSCPEDLGKYGIRHNF